MAVAFASVQTTGYAESTTVTITKPVSLSVGDIMLSHISGTPISSTPSIAPPSGWSTIIENSDGSGFSSVFAKVADSSDVAATNFTFSSSNPAAILGGSIFRITGGELSLIQSSGQFIGTASTTPSFNIGLTQSYSDSLLILFVSTRDDESGRAVSNYVVANSNPTWTEAYDFGATIGSGNNDYTMSAAYATRSSASATGNASVTISGPASVEDCIGQLVIIPSPQSLDVAAPLLTITNTFYAPTLTLIDPVTVSAPLFNITNTLYAPSLQIGIWSNQSKNSATWTAQTKNTATWTNANKSNG